MSATEHISVKPVRVPRLYISRLRQHDGSWVWDNEPRTLCETKRLAQFNRIMGGIMTQVWPQKEAEKIMAKDAALLDGQAGGKEET